MSKNSFELDRQVAKPRRSPDKAEKEVLKCLIDADRPIRWRDIKITGMAPKVLSSVLKRLRDKKYVGVMILNDEKGRPVIHYFVSVDLPFGKYSKIWHDELEQVKTKLKKKLSRQQRVKLIDEGITHVISWYKFALASALWEIVETQDRELAQVKFSDIFTTLIADPTYFAVFLSLENKDETREILERYGKKLRLKIKLRAPQSRRREKGGGDK